MTQIYDFLKDQNLSQNFWPSIRYAKNLEKDGKITLVKGKPFTGVRKGKKPYQEKYYKDGELILRFDDRYKTTVKTGLTEGEREKAMDEIYAFRAGTKYYWRYRGETRNFKPKK